VDGRTVAIFVACASPPWIYATRGFLWLLILLDLDVRGEVAAAGYEIHQCTVDSLLANECIFMSKLYRIIGIKMESSE
jgi:hypothetical protein